ncbi:MAG: hypothetical protein KGZ70_12860 [Hydrogenophaga sp.]|nr:hypothetical protein [Hydrogenophaga sp.]
METTNATTELPTSTAVRASINERKFFESMKHLFATSFSVLGELMQNARRAGATRIDFEIDIEGKKACIVDDGSGISDFQLVIALCDSGWDEQVTLTDKPFGMGLFSLFFAAEKVVFRSGGRRLEVSLDDVIHKRSLDVRADCEGAITQGTRVELIGLKESMLGKGYYGRSGQQDYAIVNEIQARAKGFPIPVSINGQECPRPDAQDHLQGVMTPVGFVSYPGVTTDDPRIPEVRQYRLYLQGLPIGSRRGENGPIVVHLDSTQFTARMPDRSDLFDPTEQMQKVEVELRNLVSYRLATLKANMTGEDFVRKHWENCKTHHLMRLMDDIPWVPQKVLWSVSQVAKATEDVWTTSSKEDLIPLADFSEGKVLVWFDGPQSTDWTPHAALVLKVMQRMNIAVPEDLSGDHWLRHMAPSVDDLRFTWVPHGVHGDSQFWGDMGACTISLCDQITVEVTSTTEPAYRLSTVFKDDWLLVPKGDATAPLEGDEDVHCGEMDMQCYVIGHGNAPDHPVDAMSSFRDEGDAYRQEWRDEAAKDWSQKVRAMKGVSLCQMAQTVLREELTNLDLKQAQHMALIRTVQHRSGDGSLRNPKPDVIDLMDAEFWAQLAKAMEQGTNDGPQEMAERLRLAFTTVVQPGWQEPETAQQAKAAKD